MVLPILLYINHILIIQQISAKMNYIQFENTKISERRFNQRQIKAGNYIIDGDEEIVIDESIMFLEYSYHISTDFIEFNPMKQIYLPDVIWTHIKEYLFDKVLHSFISKSFKLQQRNATLSLEFGDMLVNSHEWIIQQDILANSMKLNGYYIAQIRKLLLDRRK